MKRLLMTPTTTKRSISMAAFATFALVARSTSGFSADVQSGEQFARRACAGCHVVVEGQATGDPNAPSFRSVAESPQFHEKGPALLWEAHPKMPNLALTQTQLDDVAAYIKSLAK
jgi:mono/diheme cytochrome c family protein